MKKTGNFLSLLCVSNENTGAVTDFLSKLDVMPKVEESIIDGDEKEVGKAYVTVTGEDEVIRFDEIENLFIRRETMWCTM